MVFNRNLLFRRSIFRCERLVSGRGTKDDDQKFHSSLGQSDCLRVSEGHIIEKNLYNQCIRISFTWQIIQNPFGKSANHHMTSVMSVELKPSRPFAEESGWIKLTFQTFWDRVFGGVTSCGCLLFLLLPIWAAKTKPPTQAHSSGTMMFGLWTKASWLHTQWTFGMCRGSFCFTPCQKQHTLPKTNEW